MEPRDQGHRRQPAGEFADLRFLPEPGDGALHEPHRAVRAGRDPPDLQPDHQQRVQRHLCRRSQRKRVHRNREAVMGGHSGPAPLWRLRSRLQVGRLQPRPGRLRYGAARRQRRADLGPGVQAREGRRLRGWLQVADRAGADAERRGVGVGKPLANAMDDIPPRSHVGKSDLTDGIARRLANDDVGVDVFEFDFDGRDPQALDNDRHDDACRPRLGRLW